MDTHAGMQRIKVIWAALALAASIIVAMLLSLSTAAPELMMRFAALTVLSGLAVATAPMLRASLKSRVLVAVGVPLTCVAVANAAIRPDTSFVVVLTPIALAGCWLLWAAAEWVWAGFRN